MATIIADDPWDWSVDRVCQELTTNNRSWVPCAKSPPYPDAFRQSLQDSAVNGQFFLTQVANRTQVRTILKVNVINHQTWVLDAIKKLRLESAQYQQYYPAAPPPAPDRRYTEIARGIRENVDNLCKIGNQLCDAIDRIFFTPPVSSASVDSTPLPTTPAATASPQSSQGTSVGTNGQNTHIEQSDNLERASDEPAAKQLKSSSADPAEESTPEEDGFQVQETVASGKESTLIPAPEPSTFLSPDQGVISSNSDTEGSQPALVPSPKVSTTLVPESECEPSIIQIQDNAEAPASTPEDVSPELSTFLVPESPLPHVEENSQVPASQPKVLLSESSTLLVPRTEVEAPASQNEDNARNSASPLDLSSASSTLLVPETEVEPSVAHVEDNSQVPASQPEIVLPGLSSHEVELPVSQIEDGIEDGNQPPAAESEVSSPELSTHEVEPPVPQIGDNNEAPASQPGVGPDTVKQPKRLAFGMLTLVGDIDPSRNRAIPTYEDDLLGLQISDPDIAGRKRVAPQLVAGEDDDDRDSDQTDVEASKKLHPEDSTRGLISGTLDALAICRRRRPSRARRARLPKYVAKEKLPIDELFYKGVAFGADIPVRSIEPEEKYFSHVNLRKVPPGSALYVSKMMRNFMLSKQNVGRNNVGRKRRAQGPNFSTNLLVVDVERDADGILIPEVFIDPATLAGNVGIPWVEESEEESGQVGGVTSKGGASLEDSHLQKGKVIEQGSTPKVTSKVPACEGEVQAQVNDKIGTSFTAVRTYHEGNDIISLMTLMTTPSFTLYYRTSDGEVRARRERLIDWPELMGKKDPKDFVAFEPLQLIGRREEREPDYYLHWNEQPGGTALIPQHNEPLDAAELEEIAREERDELRRRARTKTTCLSPTQINTILDKAINDAIQKWRNVELPKLEVKATALWMNARRNRTKRVQGQAYQNDIQMLEARLENLCSEISGISWRSLSDATKGTRNIETTVFQIEELKWKLDILQLKSCPDKPGAPPLKSVPELMEPTPVSAQVTGDDVNTEVGDDTDTDDDMSSREAEDDADDGVSDFVVSDGDDEESGGQEEELVGNMDDSEDDFEEVDHPAKALSVDKSIKNQVSTDSANNVDRKCKIAKRTSEVINLTETSPISSSSANENNIIDLTTPPPTKASKLKLINSSISSKIDPPPYDNPMAIAEFSYKFWEQAQDSDRLLIRVFYKLQDPGPLLRIFEHYSEGLLWDRMLQVVNAIRAGEDHVNGMEASTFEQLTEIVQLLLMFMETAFHPWGRELSPELLNLLVISKSNWWSAFYKHCSSMERYLNASDSLEPPSPSPIGQIDKVNKRRISESGDEDEGPTKRRRVRGSPDTGDDDPVVFSPHSKRKRPVAEDAIARAARDRNKERLAEQETRRAILKAHLQEKRAEAGDTPKQGITKHIINDAAALDQGHIYVNEEIGQRIKQHQVEGVRFMWNQVVAVTNESSMQGCLLAHTMGLGKTMQVITLLVAIAEAASSPDLTTSSQIPSSLKGNLRTLVLCPPGLIDNWMDEFLFWTPDSTLGDFWKLNNKSSVHDRLQTISDWHGSRGVLICGYEMLRIMVQNKAIATRQSPLTNEEHEVVLEQLLNGPDIIIADEAHKLKNAKSGLASAASQFRSKCRIALTGSPLANNVEEYHSMIEFVQPGYLGSAIEFRSKYKEPIEAGLFADSSSGERRKSLKMLGVLNEELALKVNRADLSVLKNDLPPKKEFIMSVPLTDIQRKVYSLYVQSLKVSDDELTKNGEVKQATLWSWLAALSLLCNHPYCFYTKMLEGNEAHPKQLTADSGTEENAISQLIDVPLSKAGLSTAFVEEVMRLFEAEDLFQANLSNKVTVLCEILDAAKEVGDKTLVFSSSIPTLDFLERLFKKQGRSLARLDGKTPIVRRQRHVKNFNNGSDEIFLISTTAGGLGLNLQSANRVVIFDFKYNPIQEEQAVGRAYRIGQRKPTFVYRFVCGGTFEDNVHNKTVFKSQLASRVVDKKRPLVAAFRKFGDFLFEPKDIPQKDLSGFRGMDPAVLDKVLASQAETATIRTIIQTDTFQMDDEDRLTAEEQQEVDQMLKDGQLRRTNPQQAHQLARTQHPSSSLMQPSSSMAPQAQAQRHNPVKAGSFATSLSNTQRPDQPLNRFISTGIPLPPPPPPQTTDLGIAKQTPSLPPALRQPQGSFGAPSSFQAGATPSIHQGSIHHGLSNHEKLPIMRANSRLEHGGAENIPSDMVARLGSSQDTPNGTPGPGGGSYGRTSQKSSHHNFFPVLAEAYKSDSPIATTSGSSRLSENVHKRTQSIADEIKAAVVKRFTVGPDTQQHLDWAFEALRNNISTCRQLIDSNLSVDDFVTGLTGGGLGTEPRNVCITPPGPGPPSPSFQFLPPQEQAHGIEQSQSTLKPISILRDPISEQNFDTPL